MSYYTLHIRRENHIAMFKKIALLSVSLMIILLLMSCNKEKVTIIVPYGGPSYATMFLDEKDYDVEVIQGADPLVAAFGSNTYDVIIAPTNFGAKFYLSSQTYQILSTIVWGNLYLVSESEISIDDLNTKNVYAFGQNQTPDIILSYVLEKNNQNANITYLSSAEEVLSQFVISKSDVYLVAEPQLSVLSDDYDIHYIDLQEAYEYLTGTYSYPQASIFVRSDLDDKVISDLENDMMSSIDEVNHGTLEDVASRIEIGEWLVSKMIERSHIEYVSANTVQSEIETYLNLIINFNSNLLSQLPDSSFYR